MIIVMSCQPLCWLALHEVRTLLESCVQFLATKAAEILQANTFFCTAFCFLSSIPSDILVNLDFDHFLPLPRSIQLWTTIQFPALSSTVQVPLTLKTIIFPLSFQTAAIFSSKNLLFLDPPFFVLERYLSPQDL